MLTPTRIAGGILVLFFWGMAVFFLSADAVALHGKNGRTALAERADSPYLFWTVVLGHFVLGAIVAWFFFRKPRPSVP